MTWVLIIGLGWTAVALTAALLIGRAMRLADKRDCAQVMPVVPDYVPVEFFQSVRPGPYGTTR